MKIAIYATIKGEPTPFIRGKEYDIINYGELTTRQKKNCINSLVAEQIDIEVVENYGE